MVNLFFLVICLLFKNFIIFFIKNQEITEFTILLSKSHILTN